MAKTRILLIDDHALLRAGLKMLLNADAGMEVIGEAGTAIEALRLARALEPDVITLDLTMPGGGGLELLGQLRAALPEAAILVLTMHDDVAYLRTTVAQGAMGYLVKTSVEEELLTAIRTVQQGGIYVDPKFRDVLSTKRPPARAATKNPVMESLSEREHQVLRYLVLGHTNREIGERLFISPKTVETYRARIGKKLGLVSRADFVRHGLDTGLSHQSQD